MSRILVLEDEPLIAAMLADWLRQEHYVVSGIARTTEEALTLIDKVDVDAAIVDIEVRDGTAYPFARILRERRIPFAFATGWPEQSIAPEFRGQMVFCKPFRFETLGRDLRRLLSGGAPPSPGQSLAMS